MTQRFMIQRVLPALLSTALFGPLAAGTATAQDRPAATASDAPAAHRAAPVAKATDGRVSVTRSDGSTGFVRSPDPKQIRKLVGYMRDGMTRADRADLPRQSRKAIQYRRDNRSRR